MSISLTAILFIGLLTTILISISISPFVYSLYNSANNDTKADLTNQSLIPHFKELPDKVKNFILNDVVNKSKATIVVGLIIQLEQRYTGFGNI